MVQGALKLIPESIFEADFQSGSYGYRPKRSAHAAVERVAQAIMQRRGGGEQALAALRDLMRKLKLTVNEAKTRICRLPEEKFDFLGYTFGRCYSPQTGRVYLGTTPSKQRVQRVCAAISQLTRRSLILLDAEAVVVRLN